MAENVLFSWIGETDLQSAIADTPLDGPISTTLSTFSFDRIILLCAYPKVRSAVYLKWLEQQTEISIECHQINLVSPVDFASIYQAADKHLSTFQGTNTYLSILLSPGTPAMQAIWILLGKAKYAARFYQSSKEQGAQEVNIPTKLKKVFSTISLWCVSNFDNYKKSVSLASLLFDSAGQKAFSGKY